MGSTRRSFTDEYKASAVSFVLDEGRPAVEVAKNIDVHEMTLGKWVKKERDRREAERGEDAPLDESERAELIRLRVENKDVQVRECSVADAGEFRKKSGDLVRERPAVKFAAIADWADLDEFPVLFMCQQLEVSRSGFYAWRHGGPSEHARADQTLTAKITEVCRQARGNPGVRRVHAGLAAAGERVSRKRVWRLMKAAGLRGRHPRAWKRTTIHGERPVPAPDLIGRAFSAAEQDQKWCGDITYVKCWDGWAYVATVIDLHSRALIGWAIDDHMRTDLVTDALDMAIATRCPSPGVIFHSDRGVQYTSGTFANYCKRNGIRRSLGRTGICYDNAVSESFFATYKKELIHTRPSPDIHRLRKQSVDWFENYYNTIRRHSTLGYLTPAEYELGNRDINELAA